MTFFNKFTLLHKCLIVSIALHLVLLTFRFAAPQTFERVFRFNQLDVVLVNSASQNAPKNAKALAQENLDGGGDLDKGIASSPFAAGVKISLGDDEQNNEDYEQAKQKIEQKIAADRQRLILLRRKSEQMLAKLKRDNSPQAQVKRKNILTAVGKIDEALKLDSSRPRRFYIGPSTKEVVYAQYYTALRWKIEHYGTENFPQDGGDKLYGKLIMTITVDELGAVVDTKILQSSGKRNLDSRAEAIVRGAAPYQQFTGKLKNEYDQLVLVIGMHFSKESGVDIELRMNPTSN